MGVRKKLNTNRKYFRVRCNEINPFSKEDAERLGKLVEDLRDTLRHHKDLIALSAPQIASRDRVFCMKFAGDDIRTFINPLIIDRKGPHLSQEKQIGFEDCGNEVYFVPRYKEITAGYQTPTGRVESNVFRDESAAVFEQMVQLLDGLFISDFGLIKLDGWDGLTEEERKEIIGEYAKSLQGMNKDMEEYRKTDEGAKAQDKLTKFYTDVMLGNVEVLPLTEEEREKMRKDDSDK